MIAEADKFKLYSTHYTHCFKRSAYCETITEWLLVFIKYDRQLHTVIWWSSFQWFLIYAKDILCPNVLSQTRAWRLLLKYFHCSNVIFFTKLIYVDYLIYILLMTSIEFRNSALWHHYKLIKCPVNYKSLTKS